MAARFALVAIANAAIASAQFLDDDYTTTRYTSAYWTYTYAQAEVATQSLYTYYDDTVATETYTEYRTIKDGVTPTIAPYSTSTALGYYDDLEVVYAYYTTSAVAESDLVPEYDYYATSPSATATTTETVRDIEFSMPVTMTAPASCPTPFTITTSASVYVPTQVTAQLSPASIETSSATAYSGTLYLWETWYLSESAAPFTSTSDYYYSVYMADCSTPPGSYNTHTSSSGGSNRGSSDNDDSDSDSSYDSCYYYYCRSRVITWIIIIACIIPGLFLLGFLESWFWFRRLMLGKSAMRFGTVCWILMSLWVLCFTRMQDRRSNEDQKMLAERWKNMGSGAAFKAWWKWGFRHRYPEELLGQFSKTTVGFVPPGQPLYPNMAQTPGASQPMVPGQVYYYGPPPPGWVMPPNGGFVPPQGYTYPPHQQAGYYGDMTKAGPVVSQSPVSAVSYPQPQQQMGNVSPMAPQVPQAAHTAPQNGSHTPTPYGAPPNVGTMPAQAPPRSPSPEGPSPPLPPRPVAEAAPQIPPVNVSDAITTDDAAKQEPTAPATASPPPKNDPNDRSLYE
ncbi:uncharacterized protein J4E78_009166 [Alternaria triticimaculans]|uniref:uncharacterized protein n=1 Tax=Alternaria triticimaculans TaxID=297637 RepID=UPI0020C29DF7|nr:uncharacterized protein J4E78_009166 [Alternaria triticimaculans]KAI4646245.1 hypothetical protein J4E78_009166 [Alternaria triticimaculans]